MRFTDVPRMPIGAEHKERNPPDVQPVATKLPLLTFKYVHGMLVNVVVLVCGVSEVDTVTPSDHSQVFVVDLYRSPVQSLERGYVLV